MGKQVLLVGATGLVGQGVLEVLLRSPDIAGVAALVRGPFPTVHPKLRVLRAPGLSAAALAALDLSGLDACLYCAGPLPLGMTEAAYSEATVATLVRVVDAYAAANPRGFVAYISGMGADPASRLMPLRVKGEAEMALAHSDLVHTSLRPGVVRPLRGIASPHRLRRWLYALGAPVLAVAGRCLPGVFISTRAIGECMLRLVVDDRRRPAVIENAGIARAASASG